MELTLNAQVRDTKGKKAELTRFRKDRMIPAVVYGGKKSPEKVVVAEKELLKLTKAGGANAIIRLKTSKGDDTVILKELQRHVVTRQPIHADFQRISLTTKIEVKVPLRVVGEAPGVKTGGGILEHVLRELRIRALPTQIPQHIDVDVSALEINASMRVSDLKAPEGVEILDAMDHFVVTIVQPTEEAAPEPTPEEAAAAAAGAEPEVIAKGKKDEEGEEGAEAPKGKEGIKPAPGAAPAAGAPGAKPAAGAAKGGEKKPEAKK